MSKLDVVRVLTSILRQGGPELRVGFEVTHYNSDLDWISTLMCMPPYLSNTLLMSHLLGS
jgi:hypothetical protein